MTEGSLDGKLTLKTLEHHDAFSLWDEIDTCP